MILLELAAEAIKNLTRHKLRSFLTALGIICGIGAVIATISTGEGAERAILSQIGELGIRNIIVKAHKPPAEENVQDEESSRVLRYGLTFRDAKQFETTVPGVGRVLPVHAVDQWIWFKSHRLESTVHGVTPGYFDALNLEPIVGRTLTELDGIHHRRVCVIPKSLLNQAKYLGDPLKLDLKVGPEFFRVVGVLPDRSFSSPNRAVLGMDDRRLEVYVPYETVLFRFGVEVHKRQSGSSEQTRVELHRIVCEAKSQSTVLEVARCLQAILGKFHKKKDYEVIVPLELLESRRETQRIFSIVLPVIAGISLLVGGIGVLNIMLASVTERTREIGIRRAIGATRSDITLQFLIETVTLTGIGGVLGVGTGIGFTTVLERFTGWPTVVTTTSLALAMTISCVTGVLFGLYPALRAAQMDPIQALGRE